MANARAEAFAPASMGNFGVAEGLATLFRVDTWEMEKVATVGIQDHDLAMLQNNIRQLLMDEESGPGRIRPRQGLKAPSGKLLDILFPFAVDRHKSIPEYFKVHRASDSALFPVYWQFELVP